MHIYEFRCPQCAARLRCRDRSWVGRRIQCPDCGGTVLVASGNDGNLYASTVEKQSEHREDRDQAAATDADSTGTSGAASSAAPELLPESLPQIRRRRSLGERLLSPAGIGWIVAAGIGLLLVGAFLMGPSPKGENGQQPEVAQHDISQPYSLERGASLN